jgi:hypothetical protein
MNTRLLVIVVLMLCGALVPRVAAPQSAARKKHQVVRQQPLGAYERCDENCPPPGISASPSEVWCVTRPQCTSQNGCGCRLFLRKRGTRDFEYVAEVDVHVAREADAAYVCWCTKKKGE